MAYDKDKDIELISWLMNDEGSNDNLKASVHQYDGGTKKLQIGPRIFVRRDGEIRYGKLGRITVEEVQWLQTVLPEAVSEMTREDEAEPEPEEQMYDLDD